MRVLYTGSFDPFTKGHEDIVLRALELFDEVVIAIGSTTAKKRVFSTGSCKKAIRELFPNDRRVIVGDYSDLNVSTPEYMKSVGASHVVRGIRNTTDLDHERSFSSLNMMDGVDTVLLLSNPSISHISSTVVRDFYKMDPESAQPFLPYSPDLLKYEEGI